MFDKTEDKVKEVAGEAQEKYGELTDDYGHQVKGAARKVAAQGSQAAEVVRDNVENNPFAAISIAAGIGLLIGLLIGRK